VDDAKDGAGDTLLCGIDRYGHPVEPRGIVLSALPEIAAFNVQARTRHLGHGRRAHWPAWTTPTSRGPQAPPASPQSGCAFVAFAASRVLVYWAQPLLCNDPFRAAPVVLHRVLPDCRVPRFGGRTGFLSGTTGGRELSDRALAGVRCSQWNAHAGLEGHDTGV